ncbi:MAG: hypothetical protein K2Q10_01485 [Rhodospirillales bacterium]|nr:hypothetical protein [Rhodospirillales bacterium]
MRYIQYAIDCGDAGIKALLKRATQADGQVEAMVAGYSIPAPSYCLNAAILFADTVFE